MENYNIRAGGICVLNNKILLIHRINLNNEKDGQEYFVIPGGTVEENENIKDAVIREMKEETDVDIKVGRLFYEMEDNNLKGIQRKHFYYLCEYINGEPKLKEDSEEAIEMKEGIHSYNPMWVDISQLTSFILFPEQIKDKIIKKFNR